MEFIVARYTQANVTSIAFQDIFEVSWRLDGIGTLIIIRVVAFDVQTILTRPFRCERFERMETTIEPIRKAIDQAAAIYGRHCLWPGFLRSCDLRTSAQVQ